MALARGKVELKLILGLVAAALLAYVPILAEPRFHLPLIPFLAAYAATAWSAPGLFDRLWRGLRGRQPAWWLALGAVLLFLALWGWDLWRDWPRLMAVMAPGGNSLGLSY